MLGVFCKYFPGYFLRKRLLLKPERASSPRLAVQWTLETFPSLLPQFWDYGWVMLLAYFSLFFIFIRVLGIKCSYGKHFPDWVFSPSWGQLLLNIPSFQRFSEKCHALSEGLLGTQNAGRLHVLFTLWEDVIGYCLDHRICPFSESSDFGRNASLCLYLPFNKQLLTASVDTENVCEHGVDSREAPTHASEPTLPWTSTRVLMECLSRSSGRGPTR